MKFETKIFDEPLLEFGGQHYHPDPRLGLFEAGPLQTPLGDVIKIAVVGSAKTVEDSRDFLQAAATGFAGKSEKHPNLHPPFPGLGNQNPFRCRFEIQDGAVAAIPRRASSASGKSPITAKQSRWQSTKSSSSYRRSMRAVHGRTSPSLRCRLS